MTSLIAIMLLALMAFGGIACGAARHTGRVRLARAGPVLAALVGVVPVWLAGWLLAVAFMTR